MRSSESNMRRHQNDNEPVDESRNLGNPNSFSFHVNNNNGNEESSLDSLLNNCPPTVSKLASTFEKGLSRKETVTPQRSLDIREEPSPKPRTALTRYQTHLSQLKLVPDVKSPSQNPSAWQSPVGNEQSLQEKANSSLLEPAESAASTTAEPRPIVVDAAVETDPLVFGEESLERHFDTPTSKPLSFTPTTSKETRSAAESPINFDNSIPSETSILPNTPMTVQSSSTGGGLDSTASTLLMTAALNALTQAHASTDSRDPLTSALAAASAQILAAALQNMQSTTSSPIPVEHFAAKGENGQWATPPPNYAPASHNHYRSPSTDVMRNMNMNVNLNMSAVAEKPLLPSSAPPHRGMVASHTGFVVNSMVREGAQNRHSPVPTPPVPSAPSAERSAVVSTATAAAEASATQAAQTAKKATEGEANRPVGPSPAAPVLSAIFEPTSPGTLSPLTTTPTTPGPAAGGGGEMVQLRDKKLPVSALSRHRMSFIQQKPADGAEPELKSSLSNNNTSDNAAAKKGGLTRNKSLTFSIPEESATFSPPTYKDYHVKYANGLSAVNATRNAQSLRTESSGLDSNTTISSAEAPAAADAEEDGSRPRTDSGAYLYPEKSFDYGDFDELSSQDATSRRSSAFGAVRSGKGSPVPGVPGSAAVAVPRDPRMPALNKSHSRMMMDVLLEGTDSVAHRAKNEAAHKPSTKHYTKLFTNCDPRVFAVEEEGTRKETVSPSRSPVKSPNGEPYRNSIMHLVAASPQVVKPNRVAQKGRSGRSVGFGEEEEEKSDSEDDFGEEVFGDDDDEAYADGGGERERGGGGSGGGSGRESEVGFGFGAEGSSKGLPRVQSNISCTPVKRQIENKISQETDATAENTGGSAWNNEDLTSGFGRVPSDNSLIPNRGTIRSSSATPSSVNFNFGKSTKSALTTDNNSVRTPYGNSSKNGTRNFHKSFKFDPAHKQHIYGFQTKSIRGQGKLHDSALDFVQDQCLNSVDAKNLKQSSVHNRNVLVGWQILILKKGELSLLGLAVITGVRTNMFFQTEYRISTDVTLDCWVRLKRQKGYGGTEFQPLRKVLTTKQCATRMKVVTYKKET